MASQLMTTHAQRVGVYKGIIYKHSIPVEVLCKQGRQEFIPRRSGDTYKGRQWLPYGATAANPDQFFQNGTGDRSAALVQAHQSAEGVTSTPDSITPLDTTVVIEEYECLYGFTNKVYDLYEDDVAKAMLEQVGERMTLVNESIVWGKLRAGTNVFYGGTGTTLATVNGGMTLGWIQKIVRSLQANHAKETRRMLGASPKFNTSPISSGFFVYGHTDLEADIRRLPDFVPVEKYGSNTEAVPYEVGACQRFRFVCSPDLPSIQDSGAAIGALGLKSTTGTLIDVYPVVVLGQDAFSQLAVRGAEGVKPSVILPGKIEKSDPTGKRGYVGSTWYKAAAIEHNGWMAVGFVGSINL